LWSSWWSTAAAGPADLAVASAPRHSAPSTAEHIAEQAAAVHTAVRYFEVVVEHNAEEVTGCTVESAVDSTVEPAVDTAAELAVEGIAEQAADHNVGPAGAGIAAPAVASTVAAAAGRTVAVAVDHTAAWVVARTAALVVEHTATAAIADTDLHSQTRLAGLDLGSGSCRSLLMKARCQ